MKESGKMETVKKIDVLWIMKPSKGRYIPEGKYDYVKSADGQPAMRCHWKGRFFLGDEEVFVFATQSEKFRLLDAKEIKGMGSDTHHTKMNRYALGLIPQLVGALAFEVSHKAKGMQGFGLRYNNSDN
ncbi:MAG: hypothetical protein DME30_10275, partial [Verrucomicrobia bacterium]